MWPNDADKDRLWRSMGAAWYVQPVSVAVITPVANQEDTAFTSAGGLDRGRLDIAARWIQLNAKFLNAAERWIQQNAAER